MQFQLITIEDKIGEHACIVFWMTVNGQSWNYCVTKDVFQTKAGAQKALDDAIKALVENAYAKQVIA